MGPVSEGWGAAVIVFSLFCAICGWAAIEFFIWILSHISFNF